MGLETQLASEVNINLTLPAFSAETTPSSLAVAIELFELNHVPPNVGDKKCWYLTDRIRSNDCSNRNGVDYHFNAGIRCTIGKG